MAKQKNEIRVIKGAIPMKGADGRVYKVRNATAHNFEETPLLEGTLVQKAAVTVEGEERMFIVIDTGSFLSQVFESAGLADLFKNGDIKDHVRIQFEGKKDIGGGKSFNKFNVEVWS